MVLNKTHKLICPGALNEGTVTTKGKKRKKKGESVHPS